MFTFFGCIAEAVAAKGAVSLAREIPFGSFLLDIASDAWKRLRSRKKEAELRAEIQNLWQAATDEVKQAAAKAAREAFPKEPEKAIELELYLSQVPAAVRQSLRRPDDPTGITVPPSFTLNRAEDLLSLLPTRVSRFRPGNPLPGRDGWVLKDLLGTGGFGEVWLATQPPYESIRGAVKFCLDMTDKDRTLIHEGGLIDRVMKHGKHPNIVPLLGCNLTGDCPWLMYEYVSGGDLVSLAAGWLKLSPSNRHGLAGNAMRQIVRAVAHFHRLGVVHRDLKPANILVEGEAIAEDGSPALRGAFQLKVADFGIGGISSAHELAMDARMTSTGARLATVARGAYTPTYASPQQKKGSAPDPRDDVFALGVIGYQLLLGDVTAERPGGKGWRRSLDAQGVPPAMLDLLELCWDDDPSDRPADAGSLLVRLDAVLGPTRAGAGVPDPHSKLPWAEPEEVLSLDDSPVGGAPKPPPLPKTSRTPKPHGLTAGGVWTEEAERTPKPEPIPPKTKRREAVKESIERIHHRAAAGDERRFKLVGVIIGSVLLVGILVGVVVLSTSGAKTVTTPSKPPAPKSDGSKAANTKEDEKLVVTTPSWLVGDWNPVYDVKSQPDYDVIYRFNEVGGVSRLTGGKSGPTGSIWVIAKPGMTITWDGGGSESYVWEDGPSPSQLRSDPDQKVDPKSPQPAFLRRAK